VAEDYEVVDSRVLVGLELLLEELPLSMGAELVEQLTCHAYELLVGVVGRPLVLLLTLVNSIDLIVQRRPQLAAIHSRYLIFIYTSIPVWSRAY
jgi:hypothetical protein